ncbi:hypothetical protein QTG54_007109 [Skeletonema marinoi]|uniref:Uncharacterized protein n=1 Tax=Skeletonema marinoi TaxID=267567 RepID=A0AAD9DDY9_9STRA|nr:hypothetical protein QTG54_007109 [Skeletonema marinoi]
MKALQSSSRSSSPSKINDKVPSPSRRSGDIEPPRLHRDMRMICDYFRISEQSRHALRSFDCTVLEDFSFMTDEDFAEMVLSRARMNKPIPPLQQRKLRVLLNWVRSIQIETNACDTSSPPPNASEGFEVGKSNTARYKVSVRKDDISYIPNDWEDKFYRDLPRLKKELKQMGGESNVSDWANGYLSLRWLFCGD